MKCYWHSVDLDGACSGAIIKKAFPQCEMIGIDYDQEIDWDKLSIGETIYVVDFCFQIKDMKRLNENYALIWIDHHSAPMKTIEKIYPGIDGLRKDGTAGCQLTWKYIFPNGVMPKPVWLLGEYDVWHHDNPEVLYFQYGMRNEGDTHPDQSIWNLLLRTDLLNIHIEDILNNGKIILNYQTEDDKKYAHVSFELEWEGLRFIMINKGYTGSKIFDSVWNPDKHDAMCVFYLTEPGKWKLGFYTNNEDIDVSVIARKYGGDGHVGAAGTYVSKLPFNID